MYTKLHRFLQEIIKKYLPVNDNPLTYGTGVDGQTVRT